MRSVTQKSFYTFADRQDLRLGRQCDAKIGLGHGVRSTSVRGARLCCLAELIATTLARMEKQVRSILNTRPWVHEHRRLAELTWRFRAKLTAGTTNRLSAFCTTS